MQCSIIIILSMLGHHFFFRKQKLFMRHRENRNGKADVTYGKSPNHPLDVDMITLYSDGYYYNT